MAGLATQWVFERYVLFSNPCSNTGKIHHLLGQTSANEIAILGSSIANNDIIPDSIAQDCFNYGINASGTDVHLLMLEWELKKDKRAPIIVHLDHEGLFNYLGDVSVFVPFVADDSVKVLLQRDSMYQASFAVPAVRYFGLWFRYLKENMKKSVGYSECTKGANILKIAGDSMGLREQMERELENKKTFFIDPFLKAKMMRLLTAYPQRQIYFIHAPIHPVVYHAFDKKDEQKRFLGQLDSFPQVKVLDFSQQQYADTLFHDLWHLNMQGAKIFSVALRDSMRVNGWK